MICFGVAFERRQHALVFGAEHPRHNGHGPPHRAAGLQLQRPEQIKGGAVRGQDMAQRDADHSDNTRLQRHRLLERQPCRTNHFRDDAVPGAEGTRLDIGGADSNRPSEIVTVPWNDNDGGSQRS
jgi:hypothetical protein